MTHEEYIELARQAFIDRGFWPNGWECWRDAWFAGVTAERERCAKECIAMADDFELEVNQRGLVEKMKHRFGFK